LLLTGIAVGIRDRVTVLIVRAGSAALRRGSRSVGITRGITRIVRIAGTVGIAGTVSVSVRNAKSQGHAPAIISTIDGSTIRPRGSNVAAAIVARSPRALEAPASGGMASAAARRSRWRTTAPASRVATVIPGQADCRHKGADQDACHERGRCESLEHKTSFPYTPSDAPAQRTVLSHLRCEG
jgi:hypothetical protein